MIAMVESNLSQSAIGKQLVVALKDAEKGGLEFDEVDYLSTEVIEVCPHCEVVLIARMFDIDGTNLVECGICSECGYGTPALI